MLLELLVVFLKKNYDNCYIMICKLRLYVLVKKVCGMFIDKLCLNAITIWIQFILWFRFETVNQTTILKNTSFFTFNYYIDKLLIVIAVVKVYYIHWQILPIFN